MRAMLTWLMMLGLLTGLNIRVIASSIDQSGTCSQTVESCCSHSNKDAPDGHQHDGQKCPESHHHHKGCCSNVQPLTVENDHLRQPGSPGFSLLGVRHEGEVPPEGPFLSSEKPPLI
jgi:hypothetical protein